MKSSTHGHDQVRQTIKSPIFIRALKVSCYHAVLLPLPVHTLPIPRPIRVPLSTWNLLSSNQAAIISQSADSGSLSHHVFTLPTPTRSYFVSSRTRLVLSLEQNLCEEGSLINTFWYLHCFSHRGFWAQILPEWIKSMQVVHKRYIRYSSHPWNWQILTASEGLRVTYDNSLYGTSL